MFTMDDEKQLKEKSPHTINLKPKYQKEKAYEIANIQGGKTNYLLRLSILTTYCSGNYLTCFCAISANNSGFHILHEAKAQ